MTIQEQLALEKTYASAGYNAMKAHLDEQNLASSQTGRGLMRQYVKELAAHIQVRLETKGRGRRAHAIDYLNSCEQDADTLAYIVLSSVLQCAHVTLEDDEPQQLIPLQSVALSIGRSIEDENTMTLFEKTHKEYYKQLLVSLDKRRSTDLAHRRTTMLLKARDAGVEATTISTKESAQVGLWLLDSLLDLGIIEVRTDTEQRGKTVRSTVGVVLHDLIMRWIREDREGLAQMTVKTGPCIITPKPWTDLHSGGYYSPKMQRHCPLISGVDSNKNKGAYAVYTQSIADGSMQTVLDSINRVQATPWRINRAVFEAFELACAKGVPGLTPDPEPLVHADDMFMLNGKPVENPSETHPEEFKEWKQYKRVQFERERIRVRLSMRYYGILEQARAVLPYDRFWFPSFLCDRSRMYSRGTYLTPQGSDAGKAMLEFAEAKPVGERAGFWYMLNIVNHCGEKGSFEELQTWFDKHERIFIDIGNDPIGSFSKLLLWKDEEPWQLLGKCIEYAAWVRSGRSPDFLSHAVSAQDGKCNGLQHYSALLRDPVGAAAVNLAANQYPSDIYQIVADILHDKVMQIDPESNEHAAFWQSMRFTRGLTKKSVMTLPYGIRQLTVADHIRMWLYDNGYNERGMHLNGLALWLRPLLWESICEAVRAAPTCMDWFRDCMSVLARNDVPWLTFLPTGFPMYNNRYIPETEEVGTRLLGRVRIRVAVGDSDKPALLKRKDKIAPDMTHGNDASHMHFTVLRMPEGTSFAMVHDSYGTHIGDSDLLAKELRAAFVGMYEEPVLDNVYNQLKALHEDIPEPPKVGEFDIKEVLVSPYFFG